MKNSRIKRLSYLIDLLSKGLCIKTPLMAKELKVSEKVIRTDFNDYILPCFASVSYSYIDKCYKSSHSLVASSLFSKEELAVMCILKYKSRDKYSDTKLSVFTENLFDKFEHALSHEIYTSTTLEKIDDFKDEIIMIKYAIKHKVKIYCTYRNKIRKLNPLKIVNYDDFWYLVNFDNHYKDIRKYHLNSIKDIELTQTHFEVDKDKLDKFDNAINAWFKPEIEPYRVVLFLEKNISKYFKRKPLSKTQRIITTYKDGSADMEIYITDDMEIIPIIQRFLPYIKVIEPKRIEDKILQHIATFKSL